ncbi:MAG TPA: Nramp family divalent metal transporter [Gemmatimonadales bacterium]|nr:Nramp family divalent metal transporter [Gemmatimonadales bacterium]
MAIEVALPSERPALLRRQGLLRRILPYLGPAFLVSVGYMDPGNWATDIEGGARFGYTLLWVLLLSNLMAIFLQAMSARLGIVTGKSLPENCRDRMPRWLSVGLWVAAECSALATDLAEFLGAALGFNILFGIPLFEAALLTGVVVMGLLALERIGYRAVEYAIIGFVGVIGLAYLYELFLAKPDLAGIGRGLITPDISDGRLYIAIGMLGATVMPHNIYLHSALVLPRRPLMDDRKHIKTQILDSTIALNAAFFVNAAILIMSAATFWERGVVVTSIEQAHQTLTPLLGGLSAVAFAVALLASGLSSSTTATLAGQVILQGFLHVRMSMFLRRLITMIPALIVIYLQVDSLKILVLSQVMLSFGLPFAILPLIWLTNRRDVMGEFTNRAWVKVVAVVIASIIIGLNALLVYQALGGDI